jgi:uncharacterized protein YigA (DUF484 family)
MLRDAESHDATTFRDSAGCRFLQYIARVAFEAVLQDVLEVPAEKRVELVERVIDSLGDDEVELSADELAQLDDAATAADRAVERRELLPQDEVLGYMRQIL